MDKGEHMKKINIFIAKRDRDEHLKICLHYLNLANESKKYDVEVHVIDDGFVLEKQNIYDNIRVLYYRLSDKPLFFNKAKLLNFGFERARKDFDWFSIVDVDMIYSSKWLDILNFKINQENYDYVVSHGWKLKEKTQEEVNKLLPFEQLLLLGKEEFAVGPSQVTITKKGYGRIQQYFPGPLYNEKFIGWGGEDSVLSSISRKLKKEKRINKLELPQIWLHQWHKENMGEGNPCYQNNFNLWEKLDTEIRSKKL